MKKTLTISLVFLLIFIVSINAYGTEPSTIDKLLAPYLVVIDELNSELGSTMHIPDQNKEIAYKNFKNMTLEEVRMELRQNYLDFLAHTEGVPHDNIASSYDDVMDYKEIEFVETELIIIPYYIRENIKQTVPISYNSSMFLQSTVFSGSGASGTFYYENINSFGSQWPSDYTGFHFHPTSGGFSLSGDNKYCTVTLYGHPQNAYGVILAVHLTATNTFSAN